MGKKSPIFLEAEKWQNCWQAVNLAEGLCWMKPWLSEPAVLAGTACPRAMQGHEGETCGWCEGSDGTGHTHL